uniref:Uncharacterized protein n=1 Tax=Anguilla anguilla TaxID=7936 RepID=A0A0E9S748_ANGAN
MQGMIPSYFEIQVMLVKYFFFPGTTNIINKTRNRVKI